jgi:predicted transposase YbfD/YdcC
MQKLVEKFGQIPDPRRQWGNLRHKLADIVAIGLVSVVCGGTDFEHMEETGYAKMEMFRDFLELPNGIPDSDTFRRVFERIDPKKMAEILQESVDIIDKTVAIDGKTICGSGNAQHAAYHVVSAWVAENEITLGQLVTEEKSNEITAIPELLDMIDVAGSVVTIDAMGCQKDIAQKIAKKEADYVLGLKRNQKTLYDDVALYFSTNNLADSCRTLEKDHGRIEERQYYLETEIDWLTQKADWANLTAIGMVESTVIKQKTGETSVKRRYFLTSLTDINAFAVAVRKHWSIEGQLHWQLDVTFREDDCRARRDNAPLNLNILRKEALRLLNLANLGKRVSVRRKMYRAAMDNDALRLILKRK